MKIQDNLMAGKAISADITIHGLRITAEGIEYGGRKIQDAGQVHRALMAALGQNYLPPTDPDDDDRARAIPLPTTLPWRWGASDTAGLGMISEQDGTTVLNVSVTANTTAQSDLFKNLGYMVLAANRFPRMRADLAEAQREASRLADGLQVAMGVLHQVGHALGLSAGTDVTRHVVPVLLAHLEEAQRQSTVLAEVWREREQLRERLSVEKADAERYRWIRDAWDGCSPWQDMECLRDGGGDLDVVIDAAKAWRAAQAPQSAGDTMLDKLCDPPYGSPDLYSRIVRFCRQELPLVKEQDKVDAWVSCMASASAYEAAAFGYRAPATQAPQGDTRQGAPAWGPVETVADMVRNLLTLDQAAPIYAAFHVDITGERRCRTKPVTISRERVIDGKWVDSKREDVPYAMIVWAKPDEAAHTCTPADERADISAILDANRCPGFSESSGEGGGVYENEGGEFIRRTDAQAVMDEALAACAAQGAGTAPTYWNSQRKMIERAIIGLRDGWATHKDADDALAILAAAAQDTGTAPAEPIYQKMAGYHWVDISENEYSQTFPDYRRIVYPAPVSTAAAPASASGEGLFNNWRASQPDPHNIPVWSNLADSTRAHWNKEAIHGRAPSRAADGQQGTAASTADESPVAYVNGDELDNMLDDRTATIQTNPSGFRKTPLYRRTPAAGQQGASRSVLEAISALRKALAEAGSKPHVADQIAARALAATEEFAGAALARAPLPGQDDVRDAARREAWLIANHRWSVRWRIHTKKQIEQWQMVDDGEPWGQWGDYRKVLDAAIAAQSRAQSDTTGESNA
jgi:hypothetical protein